MAKPLPFPPTSSPIFTKAGPRPLPPLAGSKAQAWGGAIQQTGKAVEDYGEYLDKQTQAQGKAQMDTDYRNAMLDEMIKKRQLAMEMQKAKERAENSQFDLKLMEANIKKQAQVDRTEAHGWNRDIRNEQKDHAAKIDQFGKWLFDAQADSEKTGSTNLYNRNRAIEKAGFLGIQNDQGILDAIDKRWPVYPPRSPSGAGVKQEFDKKEAELRIPYLNEELLGLARKAQRIMGDKYQVKRLANDFMRGEFKVLEFENNPEKRADLEAIDKEARAKFAELNRVKAKAGIPFSPEDTERETLQQELLDLDAEYEELNKQLGK